jgi:phosphoserine phosphatase RsbX
MAERTPIIEWHVAGRPVAGEERSGDQGVVLTSERDALVAAVDGVGRGAAAARAAHVAIDALRLGPPDDVIALAQRCHDVLRPTRGAAVGLAAFRGDSTVTWLGVGNVSARLLCPCDAFPPAGHWLASLSGVPGDDLPALRPVTLPVRRGDVLILATDGVDGHFADNLVATGRCEDIAARLLREYARATDDALVVVARYLGEGSP